MQLMDIVRDPGFIGVSARLRVPFTSMWWKARHPEVPFWTLWRNFDLVTQRENTAELDRAAVLTAFVDLMLAISNADERLRYTEAEMNWFVRTLDSEHAPTTLAMLKAYASAPDALFTPAELAAVTGEGESTWRWRAAEGVVPGAVKKGKQWLLPKHILIALGMLSREQAGQLWRGPTVDDLGEEVEEVDSSQR